MKLQMLKSKLRCGNLSVTTCGVQYTSKQKNKPSNVPPLNSNASWNPSASAKVLLHTHHPRLNYPHPNRKHPTSHQPQLLPQTNLHNKMSTLAHTQQQIHRNPAQQSQPPVQHKSIPVQQRATLMHTCWHRLCNPMHHTQQHAQQQLRYRAEKRVITRFVVCKKIRCVYDTRT